MRIRERRYQEKLAELLSKEENLLRKERELAEKEDWLLSEQKTRVRYESLKKKSSEVLSNKTINFLRASNNWWLFITFLNYILSLVDYRETHQI